MKKIFFILLLGLSINSYGQVAMKINTLAVLKSTIGAEGMLATMIGTSSISDNNSGTYYWNPTSTATADDVGVVQVTDPTTSQLVTTGRWLLIRSLSVKAGSYTSSGITLQSSYVVTHALGSIPSQVFTQPTSANAAVVSWISNKTATTFTINFVTIPIVGTNNISFDWLVRL